MANQGNITTYIAVMNCNGERLRPSVHSVKELLCSRLSVQKCIDLKRQIS